jgi:hypothetical protein
MALKPISNVSINIYFLSSHLNLIHKLGVLSVMDMVEGCEISGSHGVEYEDDSLLRYSAV